MSTLKTNAITTVAGKPILNSTGSILQVVTNKITTFYNLTSTTEVIIYNPMISITPNSSSSLIFFDIQFFGYHNTNDFFANLFVRRNSSGSANAISSSQGGPWGDWTRNFSSMVSVTAHADYHFSCWDLPGSTNPINYILTGYNNQASKTFTLWHDSNANNSRQMQITAFEVSR